MLESPTSVTQSLIDVANDEFGESDYGKDEVRILSVYSASKKSTGAGFLTSGTKKVFNFSQQAFIQAAIFQHFDPKYYIYIKTNMSCYAIDGVLS